MKPWISTTDAAPSPVCGRSDCDERASVVRYWRSESGRRWRSTSCELHESERDAVSTMPGFRFLSEHRVHDERPACPSCSTSHADCVATLQASGGRACCVHCAESPDSHTQSRGITDPSQVG